MCRAIYCGLQGAFTSNMVHQFQRGIYNAKMPGNDLPQELR